MTSLAGLHMCIYYHSDNMFIGNLLKNSDLPIPIHATHVFFSAPKSPIFNSYKGQCIYIKLAFAVVPTDKICGRSLSLDLSGYCAINRMINKNSRWYEQHIYETVCHMTKIRIFEVFFVVFIPIKNIIFNKTENIIRRNTSDHGCQISCSKSNCETMYNWFYIFETTVVRIMNNLNVCSAYNYLYHRSWFKTI